MRCSHPGCKPRQAVGYVVLDGLVWFACWMCKDMWVGRGQPVKGLPRGGR